MYYFLEAIKYSFRNLKNNKLRSGLTMLGIIVGVSSVIIIASLGDSVRYSVKEIFDDIGKGILEARLKSVEKEIETKDFLTLKDEGELKKINNVKYVSPYVTTYSSTFDKKTALKYDKSKKDEIHILLHGVNEQVKDIEKFDMIHGRSIMSIDIKLKNRVVVIDNLLAKQLFDSEDVVGRELEINNYLLKNFKLNIIGVYRHPADSNSDNKLKKVFSVKFMPQVYMPISSCMFFMGEDNSWLVYKFKLANSELSNDTAILIEKTLEKLHDSKGSYKAEKYIPDNFMKSVDDTFKKMTLFVVLVAIVSLLVGGIGIMNIMLVSIVERTREIGIRKAIGATRSDILLQFLLESIIITVSGCIIGLVLGYGLVILVSFLLGSKALFSVWVALIALGFSSVIGLIFGIYPAYKAAKLNPVQALKYE